MKKCVLVLVIAIAFTACRKHEEEKNGSCIPLNTEFFKNANLAIGTIQATQSAGLTTVNYNTLYEKNIAKLELMSGEKSTTLCTISTQTLTSNSVTTKNYSVTSTSTGNIVYYIFRYTLTNGDWGYTGLYKFQ